MTATTNLHPETRAMKSGLLLAKTVVKFTIVRGKIMYSGK